MRDETLIEPFAVDEVYVDGFTGHHQINGNISCYGFRVQPASRENGEDLKVVVLKLVFPASCVEAAIEEAKAAINPAHTFVSSSARKRMS